MMVNPEGSSVATRIQMMVVDYDFFTTYNIALLAGRDFSPDRATDAGNLVETDRQPPLKLILNAAAARALGLELQESIDSKLLLPDFGVEGTLMGVVDDTLFESIHSSARPLVFILAPPQQENLMGFRSGVVKIRADATEAAFAHLQQTWNRLYPGQRLDWRYLEDDFQARYQAEVRLGQLFTWFSALAVLIACFGLFGLASFNAERRTKEIGVRKVMGGSVWSIVVLLTNDFSRPVLLANLLAWPIAYMAMHRWLENFAYRVDLAPVVFIGSGLIALCIAWVTVGSTAAKAATARPVLALRYE
jgi:putative ABC transport system permease protein